VLRPKVTRDHLSVISGVTMAAQFYTHISDKALDSLDVKLFVQHLLEQLGCPVLVIWDGASIHRGDVDDWIAEVGSEQIQVAQLPGYAPELNPDEGVWQYLKYVELPNVACTHLRQLHWRLSLAIMRLRSKPDLILSFFAGAGLSLE
jgi:transposase